MKERVRRLLIKGQYPDALPDEKQWVEPVVEIETKCGLDGLQYSHLLSIHSNLVYPNDSFFIQGDPVVTTRQVVFFSQGEGQELGKATIIKPTEQDLPAVIRWKTSVQAPEKDPTLRVKQEHVFNLDQTTDDAVLQALNIMQKRLIRSPWFQKTKHTQYVVIPFNVNGRPMSTVFEVAYDVCAIQDNALSHVDPLHQLEVEYKGLVGSTRDTIPQDVILAFHHDLSDSIAAQFETQDCLIDRNAPSKTNWIKTIMKQQGTLT
jgi:hypothetical protein